MVMTLALVVGGAAVALRTVDAIPDLVTGHGRERDRFATIEELERAIHQRLLLPSYFPDRLRWPPDTVRLHAGAPGSVSLEISDGSGLPALIIWQGLAPTATVPDDLPAFTRILHVTTARVGLDRGDLVRAVCADGRIWLDLRWEVGGLPVAVRSRGNVDELLRIAGSIRGRL
jgi:hypothetical protein